MHKRSMLLATTITTIYLLTACSGLSTAQRTAASDALKALKKMDAATEIGVNYQQFGAMAIEAKAEVNEASSKLPDGELKRELQSAMGTYADALAVWQDSSNGLSTYGDLAELLLQKYSFKVEFYESYEIGHKEQRSRALSVIWAKGREHIDRASKLLE